MFYPQEMVETQLIIPEKDLISVTKTLAGYQHFYQVDASYLSDEVGFNPSNSWKNREASYAVQERRILNIMRTLGIEEELTPSKNALSMIESEKIVLTTWRELKERRDQVGK